MLSLNPVLENLPVYQPGRPIEEVARELGLPFGNIAKLASNENPLGPAPAAMEAMSQALASVHLYPDGNAFYLKNRLSEHLDLPGSQIILGNGSNELIEFIGHAFLQPGKNIVVSQYCFAIYPIVARLFGADVITVPAENYGSDIAGMIAAVNADTRVVFLANPNNPTGTLSRAEDVERLLAEVPSNVLVVVDEAYFEYLDSPQDLLPKIREGALPNLMLMRTFSKIYGLAGLRIGYGMGSESLIAGLEKIRQPFNINSLAQAAALASLDATDHVVESRRQNREGVDFYEQACRERGWEFVPSFANFVLIRVGDGAGAYQALLEAGIIARPMAGYQLPNWLRISVGTRAENERCVAALAEAIEAIGTVET